MRGVTLPLLSLLLSSLTPLTSASTPAQVTFASSGSSSGPSANIAAERYDGHSVWRLDWQAMKRSTKDEIERAAELLHLDVWRSSPASLDIRLSPSQLSHFRSFLPASTLADMSLFVPDVQSLADASLSSTSGLAISGAEDTTARVNETHWDTSSLDSEFHSAYHSLEDFQSFGDALVERFSVPAPGLGLEVETIVVGKTFEGREIRGWRARVRTEAESADDITEGYQEEMETEMDIVSAIEEALAMRGEGLWDKRDKGKGKHGRKGKSRSDGEGKKGKHGKKGKKGKHHKGKHDSDEPGYDGIRELVIQAGQHAREWVGPASSLYFLHSILLDASSDPNGEIAKILKAFTITIIPTVNPDGYAYSRDHSRLWRKNRQDAGGAEQGCYGIDMNTNWGYKWRPSRASICSDTFSGHEEFEAFETRAMANYLANGTTWLPEPQPEDPDNGSAGMLIVGGEPTPAPAPGKRRVRAFVDLHSYGQLFMFPFAYSCNEFPPDAEMLMEAGLGVAKAMKNHGGQGYQAGQACDLTYRAPGDAIDYSYGMTDVRWSYSAELRDTGTYGFMLPPHLIRPTGAEVTAGLTYLAKFIYNAEVAT